MPGVHVLANRKVERPFREHKLHGGNLHVVSFVGHAAAEKVVVTHAKPPPQSNVSFVGHAEQKNTG